MSNIFTSFLPVSSFFIAWSLIFTVSPTFFHFIASPNGDSNDILRESFITLRDLSKSIVVSPVPTTSTV